MPRRVLRVVLRFAHRGRDSISTRCGMTLIPCFRAPSSIRSGSSKRKSTPPSVGRDVQPLASTAAPPARALRHSCGARSRAQDPLGRRVALRLGRLEYLLMNSRVRAAIQRRHEAPHLLELGGRPDAGRFLEVGCGRGVGVEILFERFGATRVDAFDLDPSMVAIAASRLRGLGRTVSLAPEAPGAPRLVSLLRTKGRTQGP